MKFIIALLFVLTTFAQQKTVYVAYIDGEIDLGLAPYISRVISEAEQNNADAIVFKINTFGGRVDAATQIKDAIMSSKVLTIAFVNNRAISAGALIALSCTKIVMVPGSSIGAATVVDQTGQKVGEKYQSYMRSEMRSTAERNGRRTDIAEGMVDERVVIPGLVDSTKLITLTSEEAYKYKMADTVITNFKDVLSAFNLKNAEEVSITSNWAEDVVRFLNNPIISSILIMIGFFGLMAEIKTPGWGVAGTTGLIALTLFFGSSYVLQLASILEILLFLIGLGLLVTEIFIIPGFGIAGIAGIVLIFASIFLSLLGSKPFIDMEMVSIAIIQLSGAMLFALLGMFVLVKYIPKSSIFNRLVLSQSEKSEQGFVSYPSKKDLIGKTGIAFTTLRPGGTAEIDGRRVDVVADSE
ncbi:MAG: ATP-dependent Clp protease proteolytic subunit, partial [Ignavibacteria bacterium]|nr:ATP-dependent Clp protease proteolytic subunit [Ignavibacteria bacterium]